MGSSIALYLVGHETLGQWDGVAWVFYLRDALGSIRQETDGTGAVTQAREWTPYGVEVGTAQEGLGFTGEWQDSYRKYGLLYLRARWLDVEVGRFTAPDTIVPGFSRPQSINGYPYVENNPIGFSDPTGRIRWAMPGGPQPWYHMVVEDHYEFGYPAGGSPFGFFFKQLEYRIPAGLGAGRRPDMFNSLTGDVYEVEPVYNTRPPHGQVQAQAYVDWLNDAAGIRALEVIPIWGGQVNNWNLTLYDLGRPQDWPGRLRVTMAPVGYYFWYLIADYYEPGVVIYWFEPWSTIPYPLPFPYPYREPNRRAIRRPGWSPVPVLEPSYVLVETGCELLIVVGGAVIAVTLVTDVTGIGLIDDIITVPVGLYLIDLGNRTALLIPNTP